MADQLTLKDASVKAERQFRRLFAVLIGVATFLVGVFFIANLVGNAPLEGQTVWVILAAAGGLYGFYAAQKDNRDFESGLIIAIVSSTLKDIGAVALGTLVVATALSLTGIAPFNVIVAGVAAALIAQWVFLRFWVPLK